MTIAPIRREVIVDADQAHAFELFAAGIGAWWPIDDFGVFGPGSSVSFEGDLLVERNGDKSAVWAEVTGWEPPRALRLSWHAGRAASQATQLTVTFSPAGDQTVVRLEHSGWEVYPDPAASAAEYGNGWPVVLDALRAHVAGGGQPKWHSRHPAAESERPAAHAGPEHEQGAAEDQWFALLHTPGPAVRDGEMVVENPLFGEHTAFLKRLDERGLLVAAGPLSGGRDIASGSGMTVVRVRRAHGDVDVAALATVDDLSVVNGLLDVNVLSWHVVTASI